MKSGIEYIKIKDSATALACFKQAASLHADATTKGDYKTCNICVHYIGKAVAFLDSYSERLLLSDLFNDSSVGVRIWASGYLLGLREQESLAVLEEIAAMKGIGINSLSAEYTIKEWKNGNLKL